METRGMKGRCLNELALFAGAGGGILGGLLHGWRTVAAVEIEDYPRRVLLQRQADGILPKFPVWDDVRTFDGRPWWGRVDIITGGFPCQDISSAGKGAGLAGERSGLWSEMARIISEVVPKYVLVENSPLLTGRGLDQVLLDLAEMGYDARWGVLGAIDTGAPHKRDRIWIVANSCAGRCGESENRETQQPGGAKTLSTGPDMADANETGWNGGSGSWKKQTGGRQSADNGCKMANTDCQRFEKLNAAAESGQTRQYPRGDATAGGAPWWAVEPSMGRVAHGVAHRVDQLKSLGNGQVPAVAALAWEVLINGGKIRMGGLDQ